MMNATGAEAPLRDLEPTPLAEQQVACRNPHVVENDLGGAVRHP